MLRKLSICSCVMTRMQDKITLREVINPLKEWNRSDIWEQPQQMKIPFRKKLRAD